jgi:hypothetical protein
MGASSAASSTASAPAWTCCATNALCGQASTPSPRHNEAADARRGDRERRYDLTCFKVQFGALALKAYTEGEHLLRVEATVHNSRHLGCGRTQDKFAEIIGRLAAIAVGFCTTLECVDVASSTTRRSTSSRCPPRSAAPASRALNRPRIQAALAATLALTCTPDDFTVRKSTTKRHAKTGQTAADYSAPPARVRPAQARGKNVVSSRNPDGHGATRSHPSLPAPPLWYWFSRARDRILAGVRTQEGAASSARGPLLTVTTRRSALTCKRSSNISASRHQPSPHG